MARSPIRFELAAVEELEQAVHWYRQRDPRVARRLIQATRKKIADIRAKPKSRPADESGTRSAIVGDFPYVIVYSIHKATVVIVAFAHTSREPGYWRVRLRN